MCDRCRGPVDVVQNAIRTKQIQSLLSGAKYVLVTTLSCNHCKHLVKTQGWEEEKVASIMLRTEGTNQVLCITTTREDPWEDILGIHTRGVIPSLCRLTKTGDWVDDCAYLRALYSQKLHWQE